jgi:thymidylate kinase
MGHQTAARIAVCGGQPVGSQNPRSESIRNHQDFLVTLFSCLDSNRVRYCVLHSWEELPQKLSSDLDLAVDPADAGKLGFVISLLQRRGYQPLSIINYFVGGYCFRFVWFDGAILNLVAVDVIFKHQKGVLITPSVELLLSRRRRHSMFWIPAPESEFTYLLARRMWKGMAPVKQRQRLKALVKQLGQTTAERLAGELLLGKLNMRVIEACTNGNLNPLLAQLKSETWRTSIVRNPLRLAEDIFFDVIRRIRRWLQPTGAFVAVMGTDGAGKSTLIKHLVQVIGPIFDRYRLFHWRPMLLWRRKTMCDTTRPHDQPSHACWWSVARLVAHFLDYWLGYWLVIRPLLARSGLVVFDRYFDDMLIDPKRYRYSGPLWLVRFLRHLIPKPDLILVLDAPDKVILSRKQETDPAEIQRQRQLYTSCVDRTCPTRVINAAGSISQVTAEAATAVIEYLSQRFERKMTRWHFEQWAEESKS